MRWLSSIESDILNVFANIACEEYTHQAQVTILLKHQNQIDRANVALRIILQENNGYIISAK